MRAGLYGPVSIRIKTEDVRRGLPHWAEYVGFQASDRLSSVMRARIREWMWVESDEGLRISVEEVGIGLGMSVLGIRVTEFVRYPHPCVASAIHRSLTNVRWDHPKFRRTQQLYLRLELNSSKFVRRLGLQY